MNNILIALITGLTTGGLSCLAVQGGLLASSLASQVELDLKNLPNTRTKGKHKKAAAIPVARRVHLARPILLFLTAKLLAYTLLGFLLGALGSVLQLSPISRGILQTAVGIFMLGTALRMLNVHPIFRVFTIEPPPSLRRWIRKLSKGSDSAATPLFLGALTVLIPCGVTQAMMALAVGTGDAVSGAAILFAFTLGASPLFFAAAYLTTRLGAALEKYFTRFVAALVLILGLISVDAGLTLMGAPFSPTNLMIRLSSPQDQTPASTGAPAATTKMGELIVNAKNTGYQPEYLQAPANQALNLIVKTQGTYSCSRAFVIPDLDINEMLPVTGSVAFEIPPQEAGKILYFSCSMGMYGGAIRFN
ncbi:MAG: sulfite exporter TauE/SafE family protein [Anaerolineaceae bacterium]|nr:sulfite exporter TauE/SafE family protein [Anaerolineaceae bacterium]